jgi:hypothetical protein
MNPAPRTGRLRLAAMVSGLAVLQGCATYQEARSNVAPGGALDQQKAAARQDLSNAQFENARLGNEKARREAELKRNDERLRQVERDLRRQDQALAAALKARQVDQKRHAELKRQMDALRGEAQSVDLQNKGDAFKPADASADAAKEQRLRELERRKQELETALAALAGGK